jgi:hypothetical protein
MPRGTIVAYSTNEPVPVTHGVMRPSRKSLLHVALLAGALWTGGTGLYAQTPVTLTVSATTPPPYVADQTITTDTGNPLIVNSGASVTFQAGSQIVLAPGFHAMHGSTFTALIGWPALTILAPSNLPAGTLGVAYPATAFVPSGGSGVYTWSVSAGSLPAGLTFSASGLLSGTPTAGGTFTFTAMVTDTNLSTARLALTLVVNYPPLSISTNTASLPTATEGTAYTANLVANGGSGNYAWSVTSGALPNGLSLSSAGVLSGVPTIPANFTFGVTVTDRTASETATAPFQLPIYQSATSPTISSVVQSGGQVTINGANLGTTGTVYFSANNVNVPAPITSWTASQVVATIPNTGTQNVWAMVGILETNAVPFTPVAPQNVTLSLSQGPVQMGFDINGSGFGAAQGGSTVTLSGSDEALNIVNWTAAKITVQVKNGAVSGLVVVTVDNLASAGVQFTVTGGFGCGN